MMKEYRELQQETSREADRTILRTIAGREHMVMEHLASRVGKPRLRDVSIRLGYEISGGKNWQQDVPPVCAAYELENSSSYVVNWFLDGKRGIKTDEDKKKCVIAGMMLRELADRVLRASNLEGLTASINDIQLEGYTGQYEDAFELKVDRQGRFPTLDAFMQAYEKRCIELSGVFHGNCLLAGSHVAGKRNPALYEVGKVFGSALQASNDLGDFVPPDQDVRVLEKPYNDQFSDVKQGKLTLPLYLLLTNSSKEERACVESKIGKETLTQQECEELARHVFTTGTYDACFAYLQGRRKRAKKMLKAAFPERSEPRDRIEQMFSEIVSNKFIYNLRKYQPHAAMNGQATTERAIPA